MSRFRMYPTPTQAEQMLLHCAHARYVWNLAVEQHSHWRRWRKSAPGFAEQCRQLTQIKRSGSLVDALLADHGLYHLEADLRWIEMTGARLDALKKTVRP